MPTVMKKIAKGITVCYSEVFPEYEDDYFHLACFGKLFIIADSYCMNPACTCEEAVLNFVQVFPREGKKADSFMVRFKLNGRGYKIHEHGKFTRREIKAIVLHFTADGTIPMLLNERYKEMKRKAIEMLG